MEAPLLLQEEHSCPSGDLQLTGDDGDYLPAKGLKPWWRIFCIESSKLWKIGGPIAFQIICQFGTNSIATIFVGHIGEVELSAFTIALSVVGTFSFGFLLGMGSALETLCGQAFGAGQVHMLGVYMQRSVIILFATCIILLPIYFFATPILKLLGEPDEIAKPAGFYSILTIPQLFSLCLAFPTQKFLQAQSKVIVLAWIAAFGLAIQALTCWIFVSLLGLEAIGAAIAFDITSWFSCLAQFVYIVGWCKEGWRGFSWLAFREIWEFVRLSIASAVMLCLEIWYMMSVVILAGNLKNAVTSVGALSICMNVDGLETMFFVGVNAAISVRVSNELGLGHARTAKYSVYVTVFQSLCIGIFFMIIVIATRNHFSIIFTNSENLRREVAHLSSLLGVTMLLNSVQPVISGVAIGGGWQGLVAYINLGCYYIFGLPFGYVLGYVAGFGVMGIWGGMIVGMALQTLLLIIVLYRTNWSKEVEQTTERMRKWGGQLGNGKDNKIIKEQTDHNGQTLA